MVHHSQTGGRIDAGEAATIAAISTPAGVGGIGIVRLSGPESAGIATQLTGTSVLVPRRADYRTFFDAQSREIDRGILIYFPAPHSYTGEDVVEFQCHGGPVVLSMLLARVLELGANTAEPGEFTRRAFMNGKLDLAQAEAVVDLINSSTEVAARCALRSLKGELSNQINELLEKLKRLRIYVEAAIDFPEEEIDFLEDRQIVASITEVQSELSSLLKTATQGYVLLEGIEVVIAGLPNAGKSSLLNQLGGRDRSIVTPHAGTTRDTVDMVIDIEGLAVRITDTAGLRDSEDEVEKEGVLRSWSSIDESDLVLYLIDITQGVSDKDRTNLARLEDSKILIVWNKIDLDQDYGIEDFENSAVQVSISAKHAIGLDAIREHIKKVAGISSNEEGLFLARRRHIEAIEKSLAFVDQARDVLLEHQSGELVAQDLRDAMDELGKLVGTLTPDELLGEIFASFCIGK